MPQKQAGIRWQTLANREFLTSSSMESETIEGIFHEFSDH